VEGESAVCRGLEVGVGELGLELRVREPGFVATLLRGCTCMLLLTGVTWIKSDV
jgi:hypothetical protein